MKRLAMLLGMAALLAAAPSASAQDPLAPLRAQYLAAVEQLARTIDTWRA